MPYFQSTPLTAAQYAKAVAIARKQEDKVMLLFRRWRSLSPSMAAELFPGAILKTSARRSITVLTDKGKLVRTGAVVVGPHGRNEHAWRLA